jgi:hypothetical protein
MELTALDFDLRLTGFTEKEVAALFAGGGQTEPDAVPQCRKRPSASQATCGSLGGTTCPHCGMVN